MVIFDNKYITGLGWRSRLMRGLVAGIAAVAVLLPGSAQPARAADGGAESIVKVAFAIFRIITSGATGADLQTLVLAAVGAVNQARDATISHLDEQQAAAAKAAAMSASNEFLEFDQIRRDPEWLQEWTFQIGRFGAVAKAQLDVATNRRAADQIGLAVLDIYPIALLGADQAEMWAYYGRLDAEYRQVIQKIIRDLAPVCTSQVVNDTPLFAREVRHTCVAANGERKSDYEIRNEVNGTWIRGPVDVDRLKTDAAVNSSWAAAKRLVP